MGDDISVPEYFKAISYVVLVILAAILVIIFMIFPIIFTGYYFGPDATHNSSILLVELPWIFLFVIPTLIFMFGDEHLSLI